MVSIIERLKGVTDKMGNADKAGVLKAIFEYKEVEPPIRY
ncbi:hypothetical protein JMUB3936_1397 [Leptotrichia wadei]|uniref:Uncharacterized protein n=1 Tax=Leptotrichia wadei TaxID=157687 RepID=A0A510KY35_9FUSO|nr:hypothetical protein JMUB3936_1397 [Leptotrichia wadei]